MSEYLKITKNIRRADKQGYKGIDYFYHPCNRDEIVTCAKYLRKEGYRVVDWKTDDPHGKGVGVNAVGAKHDDHVISIYWE